MHASIFQLLAELKNSEGGALPEHLTGAFVYVYLGAKDIKSAIVSAEHKLADDGYQIVQITMVALVELSEYESEEGHPDGNELSTLLESEDMLYSVFYAYEASHLTH